MLLHKKVHVVFSNLHSKVLSYELKLAAAVAHAIEGRPKTAKAFELTRSLEKAKGRDRLSTRRVHRLVLHARRGCGGT